MQGKFRDTKKGDIVVLEVDGRYNKGANGCYGNNIWRTTKTQVVIEYKANGQTLERKFNRHDGSCVGASGSWNETSYRLHQPYDSYNESTTYMDQAEIDKGERRVRKMVSIAKRELEKFLSEASSFAILQLYSEKLKMKAGSNDDLADSVKRRLEEVSGVQDFIESSVKERLDRADSEIVNIQPSTQFEAGGQHQLGETTEQQ